MNARKAGALLAILVLSLGLAACGSMGTLTARIRSVSLSVQGNKAIATPDTVRASVSRGDVVQWYSTTGRFVIDFQAKGGNLPNCESPRQPANGVWRCTSRAFSDGEVGTHRYAITIYEGTSDNVAGTGDPQVIVER